MSIDYSKPENIRLYGKCNYKGRSFFMGNKTKDGHRVNLLTLPDKDGKFLSFWADTSAIEVTKTYQEREHRGRKEYTTLASIARFVEKQKRAKERGDPVCAACGRARELVRDLEDGMMKCYGCCDMPE